VLLFFLFVFPFISKNDHTFFSSSSAAAYNYNYAVRTQLREDVLRISYEDDNMVLNFTIKTISKVSVDKVKFFGWDDKRGIELSSLTKVTDPNYFDSKTKLYTQYWSAKIFLKPGDNRFTFTSYDKDWYGSAKPMEHESSINTRNYTYPILMREQAQYNEFHIDRHMLAAMKDSMPGHYVRDCCIGGQDWYELRRDMIKCILHKAPTTAIPDDARKECAEGTGLLKGIKSSTKDDYYLPISHLNKANVLAPWWPQIYYELAMAHLTAQNYEYAKENFELYLLFKQSNPQVATAMKELQKVNDILIASKPFIKK